jgi:ABC-type sugar transport system ATPase subunit
MDRPRQLYDRPRNVFVAGFIGSPAMNVIVARLEAIGADVAVAFGDHRISIPSATMARCPGVRSQVGRTVLLGVRPEDVAEAVTDAAAAGLSGTVVALEPYGADTLVDVELTDGGRAGTPLVLSARTRPDSRARCGETVRLVADVHRLHLFDPTTEEALAWPPPRP